MIRRMRWFAAVLLLNGLLRAAGAASPEAADVANSGQPRPNVALPTLGGKQYWADELVFRGWRVQRNVTTDHCRLLDDDDVRHAWGTFDECRQRLAEIRRKQQLPPVTGKVVVVLHGMGRTRAAMKPICDKLREEGGYEVVDVGYPSLHTNIGENAKSLASVVAGLNEAEEINFVAHSMGNLVIRHYLSDMTDPAQGKRPDPRIRRIVMLGPPNHAPVRGQLWAEDPLLAPLFYGVLSEGGHQLTDEWQTLEPHLATPACEFGIVAGGRNDGQGWHDEIPGDDDGTVAVAEAMLAGAHDFAILPLRHNGLLHNEQSLGYTLHFLQHGSFVSEQQRRPLGQPVAVSADR